MSTALSTLTPNLALSHRGFESYRLKIDGGLGLRSLQLPSPARRFDSGVPQTRLAFKWGAIVRNGLAPCEETAGAFFIDIENRVCFVDSSRKSVIPLVTLPLSEKGWPTLAVPCRGFLLVCDGLGGFHLLRWNGPGDTALVLTVFRLDVARPTELLDAHWTADPAMPLHVLVSCYNVNEDSANASLSGERPGLGSQSFAAPRTIRQPLQRAFSAIYATFDVNTSNVIDMHESKATDPATCGLLGSRFGADPAMYEMVGPAQFFPSVAAASQPNESALVVPTQSIEEGPESLDSPKDPEQPTLLSQLESTDIPSNPCNITFFAHDTYLGVNNCAGHSFVSAGPQPELLFGYDVDGLSYSLTPTPGQLEHRATLPALAYILASKKDRKFIGYPADYRFWFAVEDRLVFVYATPDAGSSTAAQYVFDLPLGGSTVGAVVVGDSIVILKESAVYFVEGEMDEERQEGKSFVALDELLDRTGDSRLAGMMRDY